MPKPRVGRVGDQIGPYVLREHLGSGGNGDVWRSTSPSGEVAIKLLHRRVHADSEPYRRFVREVEQMRALSEIRGVLPLLDAYLPESPSAADRPWLATPVAESMIDALGPTPEPQVVVAAVREVAGTLARFHERGVSHRDVKPGNLFRFDGEWVVGDFGLVSVPDGDPLTLGHELGPRHYIAPEMLNDPAKADGRPADVYSLAKTMWALLTGQTIPPPGPHRVDEPALRASSFVAHPRAALLDSLISAMTRYEPGQRPTMDQVVVELTHWLDPPSGGGTAAPSLSDWARDIEALVAPTREVKAARAAREQAVARAWNDFIQLADPLTRDCEDAGLSVVRKGGVPKPTAFIYDATDHLVEAIGLWATATPLGGEAPITHTAGMLLQTSDDMPGLKLWLGMCQMRGGPDVTIAAGAGIVYPGLPPQSVWSTSASVVLDGPSMPTVMANQIDESRRRLPEALQAWRDVIQLRVQRR